MHVIIIFFSNIQKTQSTETELLNETSSCGTPAGEHPKRKTPYTRRSARGKSEEEIILEDPKLAGILLPVVSLKRLEMSNRAGYLKKTPNHLLGPLKIIASASNDELANTLGVSRGRLDSMTVSELLVLLRSDTEPLTAVRQKVR